MSTFFKALERAEQERAMRHPAPAAPAPTPTSEPTPAPPVPAVQAVPAASVASAAPAAPAASVAPIPLPTRLAPSVFKDPREAPAIDDVRTAGLEEHLVSFLDPTSFEAEQYRALRHMIEQLHRSADLSVIAVSSPDAHDGKTTTAINLAGALSQALDGRVLLIDADLRSPTVASQLGVGEHGSAGLVDAILDTRLTLDAVARDHPHLHMSVITSGRRASAPYEILKSPRVGELLADARRKYDYVIVDTPPLVSVPDSRVVAKWVDGFLLVVAAHRTPRKLLTEALNVLDRNKVIGFVFNGDDRHPSKDSYASRRYADRGRPFHTADDGVDAPISVARWSRWPGARTARHRR
jgi:capsular exopolysaccharide synthesis family protein